MCNLVHIKWAVNSSHRRFQTQAPQNTQRARLEAAKAGPVSNNLRSFPRSAAASAAHIGVNRLQHWRPFGSSSLLVKTTVAGSALRTSRSMYSSESRRPRREAGGAGPGRRFVPAVATVDQKPKDERLVGACHPEQLAPCSSQQMNTQHSNTIEFDVLGHKLFLVQDPNSKNLGTTVWDASMVLVKFLEKHCRKGDFARERVSGSRVLDLGAGCGLTGLGFALLGGNVLLTDQAEVLPILMRNADRNSTRAQMTAQGDDSIGGHVGTVEVAELQWGNEKHIAAANGPYDYIVATDVAYIEHLVEPLVDTILALSTSSTTILLGQESRSTIVDALLLTKCKQHFTVKKVSHSKLHPEYQHPAIDLFILKRRLRLEQQTGHTSQDVNEDEGSEGCTLADSVQSTSAKEACCDVRGWEARRLGSEAARLVAGIRLPEQ
eukprot:SM000065S20170  [mRNA]  locus=s65:141643:144959:+ [translate_table: standard]